MTAILAPARTWADRPPVRRLLGLCVAVLLVVALVGIASLPTGSRTLAGLVPPGGRLAATAAVGGERVLLVSRDGGLEVLVAYRGQKGWLGVTLEPVAGSALAAWTGTEGADDRVGALAAVYGRADGASVKVEWEDGTSTQVEAAIDGTYLAARRGAVASAKVDVLDPSGVVTTTIEGP